MNEELILKNSSKKKLAQLLEKAKEIGLELIIKSSEKEKELSEAEEKAGFLYTSKMNAAKNFGKHL